MNYRSRFFNKKHSFLTLEQVLQITGSTLKNEADKSLKIEDVSTLEGAKPGQISFLNSSQYFSQLQNTKAQFCLIDEKSAQKSDRQDIIYIINRNPYFAYSQIAAEFYEEKTPDLTQNNIHESAQIGAGTKIAASAYIGKDVQIGQNCFIAPNATILDGCIIGNNTKINPAAVVSFAIIGDNCTIYNGATIGQDGFGFAHHQGVNHKIIQIGIVEIADDVEIGANSCVDRGAIENTTIGSGTKIDNLVQVGHNVKIGSGTVIAGSTALAGSAKIGNFVQIGGNSSISGHLTIHDGAQVAGMTGVMRDIEPRAAVAGIPSLPIRNWHRLNAKFMKLSKPGVTGSDF